MAGGVVICACGSRRVMLRMLMLRSRSVVGPEHDAMLEIVLAVECAEQLIGSAIGARGAWIHGHVDVAELIERHMRRRMMVGRRSHVLLPSKFADVLGHIARIVIALALAAHVC